MFVDRHRLLHVVLARYATFARQCARYPRKETVMKQRGTRLSMLFVFALAMTLLSFGLPTRTSAQAGNVIVPFQDTFPFSFFNDCTGEQVSGTVSLKGQLHITEDSSGGFHLRIHETFRGKAVGETSGTKYVGPQTDHESFHDNGSTPEFTDTFTLNFRFLSAGSSDNIISHALFHITVNASGEVTSFVDNFTEECRG
jgi:hypothetical protein